MTEDRKRVVLVTGAASGLGRAIALRLSKDGFAICVADRDSEGAMRVVDEVRQAGGIAVAATGDVSVESDVGRIVDTAERELGPVDVLVNNAGHIHQCPIETLAVEDFDRMVAVHLRGSYLMIRAVIGSMLERGHGNIINMASQLGQIGGAEMAHYSAVKAGLIGLTKAMAREVSTRGVRVNAVAPGPIWTPLQKNVDPAWLEKKRLLLPLERFGEPEDVAATVAFLASDDSKIYVGQTLGPNSGDVML